MKVLVLAFHFPPSGGGGVQRTLKHVKYLPDEGILATVIAAKDAFPIRDETLLAEVPAAVNVVRTGVLRSPAAEEGVAGMLRLPGLPPAPEANLLWPDVRAGWLVPAVSEGLRAIAAESPDVIYSTHPPATASGGAGPPQDQPHPWGSRLPRCVDARSAVRLLRRVVSECLAARDFLEATITAEAEFVTAADDSMDLRGLAMSAPRRVTIGNGVDPADFSAQTSSTRTDPQRLRLAHVGTLHHMRDGASLFDALRLGVDSGRLTQTSSRSASSDGQRQPLSYQTIFRSPPPAMSTTRRRLPRCPPHPRCCSMRSRSEKQ